MTFYTNVRLFRSSIYYVGYDDNNHRVQFKEPITPKLYIKSNTPTKHKSLDGVYLAEKTFDTVKEAKEFIISYEYVTDFKVWGYEKFNYVWLNEYHPGLMQYDTNVVRKFVLDIETTTEYGFPNVSDPQEQILCITLYDSCTKIYNVYGLFDIEINQPDVVYHYYATETLMLMEFLEYWVNNYPDTLVDWNGVKFDLPYMIGRMNLVLGENVTKRLSPWGMIHTRSEYEFGDEYTVYDLVGISHLDYMQLYKKFTYTTQESYSLSHIATVELGADKLDHSEYDTFKDFYTGNISLDYDFGEVNEVQEMCRKRASLDSSSAEYQKLDTVIRTHGQTKFVSYNIIDVMLVNQIEEKMKLIELALVVSYDAKINFGDVYSQVVCWDNIIYNYLNEKNIVIPAKIYSGKDDKFTGAFVKEPIPGMYDWVVSFDLASLYPHIIQAWNISPETKRHFVPDINVEKILAEELDFDELADYTISPSGSLYDRHNEGILSQLMSKYYNERKHYKKLQLACEQDYANNSDPKLISQISTYKNIQMAKKIAMNSAYGVLGCPYFRYYDLANANSITHSGQVSIRWVSDRINAFISQYLGDDKDRIITNDTDSLFLDFNDLVNKNCVGMEEIEIVNYLDDFCGTVVTEKIKDIYKDLAEYLHFHKPALTMVRDVISSRFLIKGKKRYIANVWDAEGVRYPKPKMKIVGLEVVRSSSPKVYRELLKKTYEIIINGTNAELIDFVKDVENQNMTSKDVCITRGVSDVNKYTSSSGSYIKGTPIGARSAIIYNQLIYKKNLTHKYPLIKNGDKIKTVYLTLPNPIHEDSIGFFNTIPIEFGLEKYVNKNLQYEKCFKKPLEDLLSVIGWDIEQKNSLESFLF